MAVSYLPEGYTNVTPYLVLKGADKAIAFYKDAFGAIELFRMAEPDGRIGHAEVRIGNAIVMLADEYPEMNFVGPKTRGGSSVCLLVYVADADATFQRAVAAGATSLKPMQNQFYGDRSGTLEDPFGHLWTVATHVEDVDPADMQKRYEATKQKA